MNATGKQLMAFWLHKRGTQFSVQSLEPIKTQTSNHCGLYHYITPKNKIKSAIILQIDQDNMEKEISNVLYLLQCKNKKVTHMETRLQKLDIFQLYIEIESVSYGEWEEVRSVVETLHSVEIRTPEDISHSENANLELIVNDSIRFPRRITDLDNFQRVFMAGKDLDADHPGFHDSVYRKRRRMFAEIAIFYRHGQKIPQIKYTSEEIGTWTVVFNKLRILHILYASEEYNRHWDELVKFCNYREDAIPQLEDINMYLKAKTGFTLRPVAGYLSPRDFFGGLAFRVFHCTQYIRHSKDPFYTPEPDVCHELIGHMPLLADLNFAQFSQEIGLASLGASDEDLKKITSCYFFTVEFGLIKENGEIKIIGAGLLSSAAELSHVMNEPTVNISPFNLPDVLESECRVTTFQTRYFYTWSIEDAKQQLRAIASTIKRPFEVRYNPYTQIVETVSTSGQIFDVASELYGDVCVLSNAIRKLKESGEEINMDALSDLFDLKTNL